LTHINRTLLLVLPLALALWGSSAFAQRDATEQGLERFEEGLLPLVEEGSLNPQGIGPVLLVGAKPAFDITAAWFPTAALESAIRLFGAGNVRLCEACMNPRVHVEDGRMELNSSLDLSDIARIDAQLRGKGAPARSALWIDETADGVAVRLVSIENAQVLYAGNFDGPQRERTRTSGLYNATLELGRRLRGDSLTHIFIDLAIVPSQHISLDITEQFGESNKNLAGITFSAADPLIGVGLVYYRVIPSAWNLTVGAQVVLSIPSTTIIALSVATGTPPPAFLFEPPVTGVLVARLPIPSTSFAVVGMISTNLRLSIGLSLTNFSLLPFIP
jgi:hypothetical protein